MVTEGSNLRTRALLHDSATLIRLPDEIPDPPLPGDRAQGEEPAVVHHPAGAQPAGRHPRDRGREVRPLMGRIEIVLGPSADWTTCPRSRIAGVRRRELRPRGTDAARHRRHLRGDPVGSRAQDPASFRVSVRRADKSFGSTSPQMEREIGGRIKLARGWRVDLGNPQLTVRVETLKTRRSIRSATSSGPAGCQRASAAAWPVCSPAASILRSPPGA